MPLNSEHKNIDIKQQQPTITASSSFAKRFANVAADEVITLKFFKELIFLIK